MWRRDNSWHHIDTGYVMRVISLQALDNSVMIEVTSLADGVIGTVFMARGEYINAT